MFGCSPARMAATKDETPLTMLARSAEGLYWTGRHLTRAEHLCRLLQLQVEALVDRPVEEIHFGWRRIYRSLRRAPPGGREEFDGGDDYTLADSYTLADDLTFERANPDSLKRCFAAGRENARQMRHCSSAEMWTCLNLAWLRIGAFDIQRIWGASPEGFYADTARDLDAFAGVAETTMYRDEGWRFMRLGRFIERAQLIIALLLAQLEAAAAETDEAQWSGLLGTYHALEPYHRRHGLAVAPRTVLDFLVTDALLPHSLCHSLKAASAELASIGPGPGTRAGAEATRLAGKLCALAEYDWRKREASDDIDTWEAALLRQAEGHCRRLHELVTLTYFEYGIEDAP